MNSDHAELARLDREALELRCWTAEANLRLVRKTRDDAIAMLDEAIARAVTAEAQLAALTAAAARVADLAPASAALRDLRILLEQQRGARRPGPG